MVGDLTPSVNSDCVTLGTCLPSLTVYVNKALKSGRSSSVDFSSTAADISTPTLTSLDSINMTSTMSFTINECADVLETQLSAFKQFETSNAQVWADVSTAQESLVAVEGAAKSILSTQSEFTTKLAQVAELFQNTTERVSDLAQWVNGEKVVRNQLTDLYNDLDQNVLTTSNDIVVTTSAIRDALVVMQKVHDHATKILTAVGDAETQMYLWAFNVSQKVNEHTVGLVSIAQTLQYRSNQANAIKNDNINLNWIVTQLSNKYGLTKLTELGNQYDAGTLSVPSSEAQGTNSTSETQSGSAIPTISPS